MRVAVAGTGKLGGSVLAPLLDSSHEVVAAVQDGRKTKGFRRWLYPFLLGFFPSSLSFLGLAKREGLPLIFIDKMTEEELAPLRALDIDLLLVCGFGIILKEPLISLPKYGCLNCHSSLLPDHRGPNPFSAVILAGEEKTGVTFHKIDPGIDTGDIVAQFEMTIDDEETGGTIYHRCCALSQANVVAVMDDIEAVGGIFGVPQDPNAGCYDKKIEGEARLIDWTQSAEEIGRKIRACNPFHMAQFRWGNSLVYCNRCEVDPRPVTEEPGTVLENGMAVRVATGEGTIVLLGSLYKGTIWWLWPNFLRRPQIGEKLG